MLSVLPGISNGSSYDKIWDVTRGRVLELNVINNNSLLVSFDHLITI